MNNYKFTIKPMSLNYINNIKTSMPKIPYDLILNDICNGCFVFNIARHSFIVIMHSIYLQRSNYADVKI